MMSIEPTQPGQDDGHSIAPSAANAAAAKEQFLSLLVAQISHQNPMKPMDDKDLITQLAQFSSVEQAIETNTRLASLQQAQEASTRINMAALVGKEGVAQTGQMHISEGQAPSPVVFTLDGSAAHVTMRFVDSEGNVVHNMQMGSMLAGAHTLPWDGQLVNGRALAPGDYAVNITATDRSGNMVPVQQQIRGTITGVDLSGDEPFVQIGGAKIRTSDVVQLNG